MKAVKVNEMSKRLIILDYPLPERWQLMNPMVPVREQVFDWIVVYETVAALILRVRSAIDPILTHWGRDKMADIFLTTFSNAFLWMKIYEFRCKFHGNLYLTVTGPINNIPALVLIMWPATSQYLNQWWLDYRRIYASLGLNEIW